jgi:type IV pilus assembly protein PilV
MKINNLFSPSMNPKAHSAQQGIVLLEALVAILIFSMGVLALVGLQASMMKNASDSKFRSEASLVAQQRIGNLWSDITGAQLGVYNENNTDISQTALSPQAARTLPRATRTVTQLSPTQFQITVTWWPAGDPQQHTYTTIADITP